MSHVEPGPDGPVTKLGNIQGASIKMAFVDEKQEDIREEFQQIANEMSEEIYSAIHVRPEDIRPALPPHASYGVLDMEPKPGDDIVVTSGEQFGWRGKVLSVNTGSVWEPLHSVSCLMTRPDGTTVSSPVAHRLEYVAKVVAVPPALDSVVDADAWLAANDREIRPQYAPGHWVRFRRAVRVKRESPELDGALMKVVEDVTLNGKVIGFRPDAHADRMPGGKGPAYKVVTTELPGSVGEPKVIWVEALSIVTE